MGNSQSTDQPDSSPSQTAASACQRSDSADAGSSDSEVRLVLLGKTGNGKSSAANTILGEEKCRPAKGLTSGTDKCDCQKASRNGWSIQVTDTPGVCDTHRPAREIEEEIVKSVAAVTPGPHAILMVFKANTRFTSEEWQAYVELKNLFGMNLMQYMILVFNGMDDFEENDLGDQLKRAPANLQTVLKEAGGRYIGFNNKDNWEARKRQGDKLLQMVNRLVEENGGTFFTNSLIDQFEKKFQEEMAKGRTREEIKGSVVGGKDPTFFGSLLHVLSLGYVPKHACALM